MKKNTYKFKAHGCGGRSRKYKSLNIIIHAPHIEEVKRIGVKEFKKEYRFEPEEIFIRRIKK